MIDEFKGSKRWPNKPKIYSRSFQLVFLFCEKSTLNTKKIFHIEISWSSSKVMVLLAVSVSHHKIWYFLLKLFPNKLLFESTFQVCDIPYDHHLYLEWASLAWAQSYCQPHLWKSMRLRIKERVRSTKFELGQKFSK